MEIQSTLKHGQICFLFEQSLKSNAVNNRYVRVCVIEFPVITVNAFRDNVTPCRDVANASLMPRS